MMIRLWRVVLTFTLFLTAISAVAQTSDELKSKYKQLEDGSFLVRPNIILKVSFGENGQACRMEINPQKSSTSNPHTIEVMPWKIIDKIINELIPVTKRGKVLSSITFNSSCNGIGTTLYENVNISIVSTCSGVTSAMIIWRNSQCWEEYQRESSAYWVIKDNAPISCFS